MPPHRIARCGLSRTFQNLAFAPTLSIIENVELADVARSGLPVAGEVLRGARTRRRAAALRSRALGLLAELRLEDVANRMPGQLPFGTLKRVELARALITNPGLLLVDEPAGGLNPTEIQELGDDLVRLAEERNVTVLLVEHNMGLVMSISRHVVVMDGGKKIADGTPAEVTSDPQVIAAYLGAEA